MDLLFKTSYIDRSIRGIFLAKQKIVPKHSRPVAIPTSLPKIMSLFE